LPHKDDELFYSSKEDQLEVIFSEISLLKMQLLAQVLAVDEKEGNQEELAVDNDSLEVSKALKPAVKRTSGKNTMFVTFLIWKEMQNPCLELKELCIWNIDLILVEF
jgi:hypothetical protein